MAKNAFNYKPSTFILGLHIELEERACWAVHTVFPRSDAAATINFSFAGVRLLIKGGSYSRAAFIYFGGIPLHRSGGILL